MIYHAFFQCYEMLYKTPNAFVKIIFRCYMDFFLNEGL